MRLRYEFGLVVSVFLLVVAPAASVSAQGITGPIIRDSNVGYIDPAIPGDLVRFQFDAAFDNSRPTRSEFFWSPGEPFGRGPDTPERSVDYQDVNVGFEHLVAPQTSAFVNIPVRFLDPELNTNTAGLLDINAGFKNAFIYQDDLVAAFQLRVYAPTGDSQRGIGTGHTSLEPALLVYKPLGCRLGSGSRTPRLDPRSAAADFAGNVIRYGTGLHYDGICWNDWQLVPMTEVIGWTALDGRVAAVDSNGIPTIEDATGDTIVNIKVGLRLKYNDVGDVYMGYGRPLTGDSWYEDTFRIELRLYL